MDHFTYRDGILHAEDIALTALAEQVGTPFFVYSAATLTRHYTVFAGAFEKVGLDATVCFATKTNGNRAVIGLLGKLGAGADVVSGGEMRQAMEAGIPASKIVFSGVGKTKDEMEAALKAGIFQINVESEPELELLSATAASLGLVAPIALRVNPDVAVDTHAKITTGKKENKFGIDWDRAPEMFAKAAALPGIAVKSVAVHIGSQILDLAPFEAAFTKLADLVRLLRTQGVVLERIDLGGGLGIPYRRGVDSDSPPPDDYAAMVKRALGDLDLKVVLEPGRLIAGNAGMLISKTLYVKKGESRTFLILDAAMNDLIRPAMYEAYHDLVPITQPDPAAGTQPYDVVGPVCETGDTFAKDRPLPPMAAADLIAFATAGAYGAVMSSTYNGRPLAPEVLVSGDRFHVIRRRPSFEEMMSLESVPDW
ncbi:MAG: diaminopimelate decarboxylase [Rhodospirillaceae bacterium]